VTRLTTQFVLFRLSNSTIWRQLLIRTRSGIQQRKLKLT